MITKEPRTESIVQASVTSETSVVIKSQEIERQSAEEEVKTADVGSSSEALTLEADDGVIKTTKRKVCASNEFEKEEGRDLQEILMHKLQLNLPEVLKEDKRREDLFQLPREALEIVFSNSETCCSEYQLF